MFRRPWGICCGDLCKARPDNQPDSEFRLTDEESPGQQINNSFNIKSTSGEQSSFVTLGNGDSEEALRKYFNGPTANRSATVAPHFTLRLQDLSSPLGLEKTRFSSQPKHQHYTEASSTTPRPHETPNETSTSVFFSPHSFEDSLVHNPQHWYDPWSPGASIPLSPKRYSHKRDPSLLRSQRTPRPSGLLDRQTGSRENHSAFPYSPRQNSPFRSPVPLRRNESPNQLQFSPETSRTREFFDGGRLINRHSNAECSTQSEDKGDEDPRHAKRQSTYASPPDIRRLFDKEILPSNRPHDGGHPLSRVPVGRQDVPQAALLLKGSLERNREHSNVRVLTNGEEIERGSPVRRASRRQNLENRSNVRTSLSRINSMPAEVRTFEQKQTSLAEYGGAVVKPGRSDPDGREEKNIEKRKENDADQVDNGHEEKKRSDPATAHSNDEADAIFLNPPVSVIGRFNGWDHSTTRYLQKTRRTAKSVSGSAWTRSVDAFSAHRLLQSLTFIHRSDSPDREYDNHEAELMSIGSSTEYLSDGDADTWDSSDVPNARQRKNSDDRDDKSSRNLPSNWAFVPRRLHSSASLWILVGSSVRKRVLADTPDSHDEL